MAGAPKRRTGAAAAAAAAAAAPRGAAQPAGGAAAQHTEGTCAAALPIARPNRLLDAALVLVVVLALVCGRPAAPPAAEHVGEILRGADFQAAYESTYLHLPGAVDVTALAGAERRLFARLDPRSAPSVLVYRDGEPWQPPTPVADADSVDVALAAGATVVVNSAQGADSVLAAMALSVTAAVGIYADVNLYVTPPDAAGLHAHHDQMDSVVVQGSGSKRWLLCDPVGIGRTLPTRSSDDPRHPLYNRYDGKLTSNLPLLVIDRPLLTACLVTPALSLQAAPSNGCRNITLAAGDLLYLPRGVPHAPYTEPSGDPSGGGPGANSVHWTIGLLGDFIWEDYLKGLTIATPGQLDPSQLPVVSECVDPRSINRLVPHDALESARLAAGSGSTEERDALAAALAKGFEGLAWREGCASALRRSLVACGVSVRLHASAAASAVVGGR